MEILHEWIKRAINYIPITIHLNKCNESEIWCEICELKSMCMWIWIFIFFNSEFKDLLLLTS